MQGNMGLFSRKKVVNQARSLPEFPRFPDMPAQQGTSLPRESPLPRYEPTFQKSSPMQATQSQQLLPPVQPTADIPPRQPAFLRQDPLQPERRETMTDNRVPPSAPSASQNPVVSASSERVSFDAIWKPPMPSMQQSPVQAYQQPVQQMDYQLPPRAQVNERLPRPEEARMEEKPVFVRLQQYREAMSSIELLKQKIQDIEFIIGKIEELRAQEQVELNSCQNTLNRVKEKLIAIDKKLFEV